MSPPPPLLTALVWLLTAVAVATAYIPNPGLSCNCFLRNVKYHRIDVSCGQPAGSKADPSGKNVACEKESVNWIPPGYQYVASTPALYKIYRAGRRFAEAEQMCKRDGGHLAVPRNKQEADAVAAILKDNPAVNVAYIGINDIEEEGTFLTVNKQTPSYLPFQPGRPDSTGENGEDCIVINNKGEFYDIRCTHCFAYVCQRDIRNPPPEGYRYVSGLGFYKLHTSPLTYHGARERCRRDGGHLAVLDSLEEIEELAKLYDGSDSDVKEAYIGLNDIDIEGRFVSETGKRVEELPFTNWNTDEPNNANGGENCVTFHLQGNTNDVKCQLNYPFFCEIPLVL